MTTHDEPPGKRGIIAELSHRHVWRAAAVYVGAVWALSQGIAQLSGPFGMPDWVTRWFVIACAIGFPFWVAFAWYYKLTPEGLKLESDTTTPNDRGFHRAFSRKLDIWIIGVMAVAIVLLVTNTFVLHRDVTSTTHEATTKELSAQLAKVPAKSVAVLPFTNESGDAKQQYFSDGMSEELISDLTQIDGLKVIGQYSSFKFRDSKDSPAQIGTALGVANLIHGSVFQQGGYIRVNVSMIRAANGQNAWSHSYDEQLKDVFAIQSQIGHAVAAALKVKLMGNAIVASDQPPSGNVQAYELMLQGRAIARHGTETSIRQGIALFQQVLKLDPKYAYAWGLLANSSINLGVAYLSGAPRQQAYAQARAAAAREQALAPNAAFTHIDHGWLLAIVDNDSMGALAEYRRAHQLAPNDIAGMNFLANGLMGIGQLQRATKLFRAILARDPLRNDIYPSLALALLGQGQLDAATQAIRKALAWQPNFPGLNAELVEVDVLRGDAAAAQSDAAKGTDPTYGPWARALAQQIGPAHRQADAALHDYIAKQGKAQPYLVADLYALRKQPDEMFDWLRRAWVQRDPDFMSNLLTDPFVLAYRHDPRFAALCKDAGLPVPGQTPEVAAGASDP
ncbi:MAG: tetratricopeptide repeat protein [Rhodanobacteraceae bacterium]